MLGQLEPAAASFWKVDLRSGRDALIGRFASPTAGAFKPELWFDVAYAANTLVTVAGGAVVLFDLSTSGPGRELFSPPSGVVLQALPSITADGTRVVVHYQQEQMYGVLAIDVATGKATTLVRHGWWIGHTHFLPYDPTWILFCHEGRCDTVPDRMWAYHPTRCPQGRVLFDQASSVQGTLLQVGHEVGCHHDACLLAVAYGVSDTGPRGVYQISLDGRAPKLVSSADRDLHCNISRNGRWIVVDTSGPHDAPGRGWQDAQGHSDVLLVDAATGVRSLLARSHILNHPWHPHPAFSPDGNSIIYGEAHPDNRGNVHLLTLAPAVVL